ncbi:MAG TPA: metallophosphoesterase [Deinococcales bacterium]|nr:metallophosphoesterase [Deinococcales bacterium]
MPITIADLHGRLDLLDAALAFYGDDAEFVFLGDATDRGENSRGVIERLAGVADAGRMVLLRGNHEQMLLKAMHLREQAEAGGSPRARREAQATFDNWLRNGGDKVVSEYGGFDLAGIPAELSAYVKRTVLEYRYGAVLCTHAAPPVMMARYNDDVEMAMLWARPDEGPFDLPPGIERSIHGHTPLSAPTWVKNHLYTDLGAVHTGALCTVDLDSFEIRVLQGPSSVPLDALPFLASSSEGMVHAAPFETIPVSGLKAS